MIKLTKLSPPRVLVRNSDKWKNELMQSLNKGNANVENIVGKYRHREVKDALIQETYGKCMYCESKMAHILYEHIKPKDRDKFPHLTFEWTNLGLACQICNNNKHTYYCEELPVINPYQDDPSDYLVSLGSILHHKPGNRRGEITHKILELNRAELVEERAERVQLLQGLADKYAQESNPVLKDILLQELKIELMEDKPYSFTINSVYKSLFP